MVLVQPTQTTHCGIHGQKIEQDDFVANVESDRPLSSYEGLRITDLKPPNRPPVDASKPETLYQGQLIYTQFDASEGQNASDTGKRYSAKQNHHGAPNSD